MSEYRSTLLVGTILAVFVCGCCPYKGVGTRTVTLRPQETNNWCWAASTQMVTESLGENIAQCDMANKRFNRNDCCTSGCPKNPACNKPGWTMFSQYGYDFDNSSTPLTWDQIKHQICKEKRPMAYAYGPKSGGVGHVVVIRGFSEVEGSRDLLLRDPWSPCNGSTRAITFQEYTNSLTTNHWSTMYNIKKKNS